MTATTVNARQKSPGWVGAASPGVDHSDGGPARADTSHEYQSLADLLSELLQNQTALLDVLRCKLDAMRRSHVADLQAATADEAELVEQLQALELRRQSVHGRFATPGRRPPQLSRIIAHADQVTRSQLDPMALALRERMLEVAELTRVVALVSRGVSDHLRALVSAVAEAAQTAGGYGRNGREVSLPSGLVNEVG